jgi:hypothetical protein
LPRGSDYLLSLLNDHFFMFVDPESLLIFCLLKGPVCFGTAKVETFSSSAKLIFFIFVSPYHPHRTIRYLICGLQRYAAFWIAQIVFTNKALCIYNTVQIRRKYFITEPTNRIIQTYYI